nr:hypothetical protein [Tanacetum cinerariifolium]
MEDLNVGTGANKEPIIVDQHYGISDLSGFQSIQGGRSSFHTPTNHSFFDMGTPINWPSPRPLQPELPKKRVGITKKKCKNDNLSPLNLGNAFAYDNAGGDDILITSVRDTGIYFTYENVDPNKQMNAWIEILIRSRLQNTDWTVCKSGTTCVHIENYQFMIETDPHIIGTLDGSTRPYPPWKYVNWVYMPINVGEHHWVTSAEDHGRQLAIMNLGHQFDNAITAKDELQKAYEECRDIPLVQRALIKKILKIESELDQQMQNALFRKAAKLEKQIRDKNNWLQQL